MIVIVSPASLVMVSLVMTSTSVPKVPIFAVSTVCAKILWALSRARAVLDFYTWEMIAMILTSAFLGETTRAARMPPALTVLVLTNVCAGMASQAMEPPVPISTSVRMAAIHAH